LPLAEAAAIVVVTVDPEPAMKRRVPRFIPPADFHILDPHSNIRKGS
jgi:hypothetical protein